MQKILLLVAVLFTSYCSQRTDNVQKDEIVFANFRDIRDPHPHLYQGELWAQNMLFDTLVSLENNGIQPSLAQKWDISKDGKTYTFDIRRDMKFSDGETLDAYAIEKNFDALWDNKNRHAWLGVMQVITNYQATDAHTFVLKLSEPYYPLLIELGLTRPFGMLSPRAMKDGTTKDGILGYIGSGPYTLVETKKDEYAIFEANTNYWGDQPKIQRVIMKVIPDNYTRIFALQKGEISLIYGAELLDAHILDTYKTNTKYQVSVSDAIATRHLVLNSNNPILKDIDVRYALSHAINKKDLAKGIFHEIEPPADFLYATNIPYANIGLKPFAYDIELAKSYLDKSGWLENPQGFRTQNGQTLSFNLLYDNNSVTGKTISEYLQGQLSNIGIEIKLIGLERQTYIDALKQGDFDIAHNIAWGSPYDPQSSLLSMTAPVHGDYQAQLGLPNKAQIDKAIKEIFVTVDENKRQQLYRDVLTTLHESALYIPLTAENNKALYSAHLSNVLFKPSQYIIPFEDISFTD
ncbi:MAG: nickel ABC transporter substrate-binding protein [Brevinema sp.]